MVTTKTPVKSTQTTRKAPALRGKIIPRGQAQGFIDFLREQSVVGLAIGLILGTQAKDLIGQLMTSFINPLTGLLLPGSGATLQQKTFTLHLSGKVTKFGWGAFVSSTMTFVIVAAVVYFTFKMLRLDKLDKKKEDA